MCSCGTPSPVYLDPVGVGTPFLEDVFGAWPSLSLSDNPYGLDCHCWGGTYYEASLSSVWAVGVVVLVFAAGLTSRFHRRAALCLLICATVISLLDFSSRFLASLDRVPGTVRDLMWGGLPGQILSNLVFQFGIPFAAGLVLAALQRRLV